MLRSLVGSEMCIRDSPFPHCMAGTRAEATCQPMEAQFLPGRLTYAILAGHPPASKPGVHQFSVEDQLVYEPFFADFGPLSLGQFVRFCETLDQKLADPSLSNSCIVFYSTQDPHHRTNGAVLIGMYAVARLGMAPHQAYAPFEKMHGCFVPFRDASMGPSCFDLTVMDCLRATYKASLLGWFDLCSFDLDRYERYEQVENGDLQEIIPGKFVHCAGPAAQNHETEEGWMLLGPESYVPIFQDLGVRAVVRLNKPVYERAGFKEAGIEHYDMYFTDGGCPSDAVIERFLQVCEATYGAVAVQLTHQCCWLTYQD
eukprot:TRINITY_DN23812_c0_g1_i2.p1 TRINITY_DN23812_c0_g1~~TRINITY_DN23812_c0_g1_i2.p1  ORF type:complete len:314 (-),score=53.26 TRINITY_DN23812_c0_g1_i2:208-1149(-)